MLKIIRRTILLVLLLAAALLGVIGYSYFIEPNRLTVKTFTVTTEKEVSPCTVVFFTDTHFGEYYDIAHAEEIVDTINGLDPEGIVEFRNLLLELNRRRETTILISSHILSEIALLADDIGIIDHGVLLEEESLAELEQKNGKLLRFTVSNAPVAAQLLQQELGVRDVTVENERDLTVRDLRLDTGAAVRRFVEAGLVVSDAHLYEDTLEDYFKRITGGEGIA